MIDIAADEVADVLSRARNGDGGWGYFPDKVSRLEPTAWAILALSSGAAAPVRAGAATDWTGALRNWPSTDGVLLEHAGGEPNFAFHGLALLALLECGAVHTSGNAALLAGMQRVKGMKLSAPNPGSRQDNSLQAWPWFAGTFSWVEPTAWCLLSLKKWAGKQSGGIDAARVSEAERVLIDRSCAGGGWNFGNADVMGQDLRPYVPTTAMALLAMQDRLDEPAVKRSLDYLEAHATSERSGTALGLALIALRACGRPQDAVRAALLEQLPTTIALRNIAAIALASYALGPDQPHDAFRI